MAKVQKLFTDCCYGSDQQHAGLECLQGAQAIEIIRELLNQASVLADEAAADETTASSPFTLLAQLIDSALARVEAISEQVAS